jgi:hypothetical protein
MNVSIAEHFTLDEPLKSREIDDLLREIEIHEADPSQGICYEQQLSWLALDDEPYTVNPRRLIESVATSLIDDITAELTNGGRDAWLYEDCYLAGVAEHTPYWAAERLSSAKHFSSAPLWRG